jgi:hypothetical protein
VFSGQIAEVVMLTCLVALMRGFRSGLSGTGRWLVTAVLAMLTV